MKKSMNVKKKIPTGVKVISILNFIVVAFLFLFGVAFIILGGKVYSNPDDFAQKLISLAKSDPSFAYDEATLAKINVFANNLGPVLIVWGIIWLVLGVFLLVIGIKMWKAKNWARMGEIILCSLIGLWGLAGLFNWAGILAFAINLIFVIVNGAIVAYLGFNKEVKKAFSKV
jgi:hypothetical protein